MASKMSWKAVLSAVTLGLVVPAAALCHDPVTTHFGAAKAPVLAASTLLCVLFAAFGAGRQAEKMLDHVTAGVLLLLGWAAAGLFWTSSFASGLSDLLMMLCGAALFFSARAASSKTSSVLLLAAGTMLAGLVVALICLYEYGRGLRFLPSTMGNPNHAAALMAASFPLAFYLLFFPVRKALSGAVARTTVFVLLVSIALLWGLPVVAAILATGCQSALAGLAASLVFLLPSARGSRKDRFLLLAAALSLVLTAVAAAAFLDKDWRRSFEGRAFLGRISFRMLAEKPLRGMGPGSYAHRFPEQQALYLEKNPGYRSFTTISQSAHCEPLQAVAELGLGGLAMVAFCAFLFLRAFAGSPVGRSPPCLAVLAALVVVAVCSLAEASLHEAPLLALSALALGLAVDPSPNEELAGKGCEEPRIPPSRNGVSWRVSLFWTVLAFGVSGCLVHGVMSYRADRMLARFFRQGSLPTRMKELEAAERMAPNKGKIRFYMGLMLLHNGKPAKALFWLKRSLPDFPNLGTHLAIGNALMELHRAKEAAAAYRKAAWLNPRYAAAHHNLAVALRRLGRTEEAHRSLLRAHKVWPGRWPHDPESLTGPGNNARTR